MASSVFAADSQQKCHQIDQRQLEQSDDSQSVTTMVTSITMMADASPPGMVEEHLQRPDAIASPYQLTETGTESTGADDWLLEDFDQMSVRTQTLDEIMAEKDIDFLFTTADDEDDLLLVLNGAGGGDTNTISIAAGDDVANDSPSSLALAAVAPPIAPMGRYGATATELPNAYALDSPLLVQRADALSHQIASVHERPTDAGRPTVLCVGRQLIAVGTARGLCLLFERATQRLRRFIRAESAFGAISCLDFSSDLSQQRLCAGHSSGALTVFDCARGRVLFSGDDLIQPGRSVLHVKYIASHVLLIVDSGGNVYEFHERHRQNYQRNSAFTNGGDGKRRPKPHQQRGAVRCLFAGSKGEVTNICFVHTAEVELLVLATFNQVLLLSTKRRGAPVGQLRLHGSSLYPPVIDWRERRMSMVGKSGAMPALVRDLRLCIGRGCEVRLYQVRQRVGGDLLFPLVGVLRTEQPLLNLKWLDNWALLTIVGETGREQLQLLELHHEQHQLQKRVGGGASQKELGATLTASAEIGSSVQLLYNSADFKGLATGRNVSEAMSRLADSVCLHSVCRPTTVDGGAEQPQHLLYLLGRNGVFTVQLMDQVEQLDALVAKDDFTSALLYAVDVCNGRVRDRSRCGDFRAKASHAVPQLVKRLLDQTIDGLDSGSIDELVVHYKRNIHVLLRACISTSHFELLYGTVYGQLQKDSLCRPIFLELLEEFVLDAQLDRPPPGLVNDYLAYLLSEGQLPQFEQSVTRLPVNCMDLHQVMTTCLQHQLFDGLCHVMNNAMRDYIGPLKEMCEHMQHTVRKEVLSDCDIAQGNKLLLYLSCCLVGRAYPYSQLPDEHLAKTVPLETYKFLVQLRPKFVTGPPSSATTTPSPTASKDDDGYQVTDGDYVVDGADQQQHGQQQIAAAAHNQSLHNGKPSVADLRFPHLQLLLKLDPQQFLNVINTCADAPVFASVEGRLKRLVDVLIAMCVENNGEDERNELGPLLIAFVVGLLQKGAIPRDVFIYSQLIKRVLQRQFLNVRAQKQAEQHIVDLLRTVPEIDLDNVLDMAQKRPYVHICAYIFTIRKQYVQLLECCLGDIFEPKNVFHILADLLTNLRDNGQLSELRQFVHAQLGRLSNLDSQLTAHLVMVHLPEMLNEARSNPRKLPFQFVRNCFALRRQQGHCTLRGVDDDSEQDEQFFDYLFEGTIDEFAVAFAATATDGSEDGEKFEASITALDNELADLLRYWLSLGAATDHCLNVAMQWQQKQRPNAVLLSTISLLLVARGHIQRAFEHIFTEGIQRRLTPNKGQLHSTDDRCVSSLLELAAAHPADARRGDWLAKLFRHLLKALPEGTKAPQNAHADEFTSITIQQQLIRPNSQLFRVLSAIIEQQHHHHDEEEEETKLEQDDQHGASASVLVAELFSHPLFQHAPLHIFHRLLRQILLWCEIRVLMERATRDCARHELAVQFVHNNMLGLGKRPAFSIQRPTSVADECAANKNTDGTPSTAKSAAVVSVGVCLWCRRRIAKSFYLFPCGHTLHLECVEEQHQLLPKQSNHHTSAAMATAVKVQRRRRFCPCTNAEQYWRHKWWWCSTSNSRSDGNGLQDFGRDDDVPTAAVAQHTPTEGGDHWHGVIGTLSTLPAVTGTKEAPLATTAATEADQAAFGSSTKDKEMDERRIASAVFRRLEQDFPICTGPPPPAKTANNAFQRPLLN